jgi:hypothetical protein
MGAHQKSLERIARNIREHPGSADYWLDQWIDVTTRATEWDAEHWGFHPDKWMAAERLELEQRSK